ncbi:Clr6 histone deacetylase associated PHD protein-2 Cph2 [Lithohypha guttulata]|uniref:Clr6 histone deacetylase associated PHD protein-2 Cph2 n=1 Tax=Lithohypha guttulata TaxID=1690604 RepID=UPI002DE0F41E|nr:Clr6 histone deacetylase associated PHD protein-2 Cph2 [Lithohypha guttulata]
MEPQLDPEIVGKEFDKWLDWDAVADEVDDSCVKPVRLTTASGLPISPISTANSDSFSTNTNQASLTASYIHDLPTPTHSSSSPETALNSYRLNRETARVGSLPMLQQNNLKRKISADDDLEHGYKPVAGRPTGSKRPHNVIEKRYRANLNEKISELRDSVPALRVLKRARTKKDGSASSGDEDLDGLAPSNKLNKASILTKAVEYIHHLETRSRKLEDENTYLKDRVEQLEKMLADKGNGATPATAFTSNTATEESSEQPVGAQGSETTAKPEVKGLIGLPDSMKRLRESQPQEHYGHVYATPLEKSRLKGKWPQRIMLASVAGLMIMEGISESDQADDSTKRALFGIPLEILDGWQFLRSPRLYLATFAEYCRAGGVVPLLKGFMTLTFLAFLVFYYMFNSKPASTKQQEDEPRRILEPARPASPIQVRRRAWSTSMQALGLPHHSFFPEWFAVTSEWVNYSIRYWLGPSACLWLCGETAEDETARVKAWDIAIDAQLAGGDTEISHSRVVLTIFGSGTLPATPLRLMMKAIHCKLVLHNVGLAGTLSSNIASRLASYLADRQWRRARQLHEALPARDADRLPGYLNYLLQMDCDDVLTSVVTQRAYNMMYDRPTSEHAEDILHDVVVEDHAIKSPLDAIAAWLSTSLLHEALVAAVQSPDATDLLREHIQAALEIAPPGSASETRALAVHAVLSPGRRHNFYLRAADAIRTSTATTENIAEAGLPFFIDSSTPKSARPEIETCLSCAEVMFKLEQQQDLLGAVEVLTRIKWPELGLTSSGTSVLPSMLSVAPLFFVLTRLLRASRHASDCSSSDCEDNIHPLPQLTLLAKEVYHCLRVEASRLNAAAEGCKSHLTSALDTVFNNWVVNQADISRRPSSASHDTGYGSLEDEDDLQGSTCKRATTVFEQKSTHFQEKVGYLDNIVHHQP